MQRYKRMDKTLKSVDSKNTQIRAEMREHSFGFNFYSHKIRSSQHKITSIYKLELPTPIIVTAK